MSEGTVLAIKIEAVCRQAPSLAWHQDFRDGQQDSAYRSIEPVARLSSTTRSPASFAMPRYTFTVVFGTEAVEQPFVRSLGDADAAWQAARVMIRELMTATADARLISAAMIVTDAAGEIVFELPFAEVMT
ncbi:DUF6894 family protein [Methylobacterium soli]|nr:hypothetical protein [Methylobacterium soli]